MTAMLCRRIGSGRWACRRWLALLTVTAVLYPVVHHIDAATAAASTAAMPNYGDSYSSNCVRSLAFATTPGGPERGTPSMHLQGGTGGACTSWTLAVMGQPEGDIRWPAGETITIEGIATITIPDEPESCYTSSGFSGPAYASVSIPSVDWRASMTAQTVVIGPDPADRLSWAGGTWSGPSSSPWTCTQVAPPTTTTTTTTLPALGGDLASRTGSAAITYTAGTTCQVELWAYALQSDAAAPGVTTDDALVFVSARTSSLDGTSCPSLYARWTTSPDAQTWTRAGGGLIGSRAPSTFNCLASSLTAGQAWRLDIIHVSATEAEMVSGSGCGRSGQALTELGAQAVRVRLAVTPVAGGDSPQMTWTCPADTSGSWPVTDCIELAVAELGAEVDDDDVQGWTWELAWGGLAECFATSETADTDAETVTDAESDPEGEGSLLGRAWSFMAGLPGDVIGGAVGVAQGVGRWMVWQAQAFACVAWRMAVPDGAAMSNRLLTVGRNRCAVTAASDDAQGTELRCQEMGLMTWWVPLLQNPASLDCAGPDIGLPTIAGPVLDLPRIGINADGELDVLDDVTVFDPVAGETDAAYIGQGDLDTHLAVSLSACDDTVLGQGAATVQPVVSAGLLMASAALGWLLWWALPRLIAADRDAA